jgi:hypothetical protein
MKRTSCAAAITTALAAFALPAWADGPTFTVSGFGTAALTWTDTDQAEYIRPNQLVGAKESPRTSVDSNFGIQTTVKFNDTISATVQGLARKNTTDDYTAEMPWAFVKFKVNDELNVRVGRIAIPIYMISDFRNVGYANTMLRPPAEVYRQVNGGSLEGVDLLWQHNFGDTTVTTQFGFGRSESKNAGGSNTLFHPVTALHILAENGPFTFRFGRADAKFDIRENTTLNGLIAALKAAGPVYAGVVAEIPNKDIDGSFTSVGMMVDYNNFLVQTEYAVRKTKSRLVMDTKSWYAMFGYRFGKITPYYYHGNIEQDSIRNFTGLPTAGPAAALTAGANSVIKAALQSTNAIGVRWDFYKSAALKLQIDRVSPKDGPGAFVKATPAFKGPVTVYAAAVDFVF